MSGPGPIGPVDARVAICTLADENLRQRLMAAPLAREVIIGPLTDGLHGVEMLAGFLLAHPTVRFLVVPGKSEPLRALFAGEATWPNLPAARVAQLRRQVQLKECRAFDTWAVVGESLRRYPGPFPEPEEEAPAWEQVARVEACFEQADPGGYVLVGLAEGQISVAHYRPNGTLSRRWLGPDSHSLAVALARSGLIRSLDHGFYLGRELMKAEVAQRLGLTYTQDEPLQLT